MYHLILLSVFGLAFVFTFYSGNLLNLITMIFLSLLLKFRIDKFIKQLKIEKLNDENLTESEKEYKKKIVVMLVYILIVPSAVYLFYAGKETNIFIKNILGSVWKYGLYQSESKNSK